MTAEVDFPAPPLSVLPEIRHHEPFLKVLKSGTVFAHFCTV